MVPLMIHMAGHLPFQLIKLRSDAASSVPAAVVCVDVSSGAAVVLANPEVADERRDEPQERREKGKGNVGLELAALVATRRDVVPVEDGAAGRPDEVDEQPVLETVLEDPGRDLRPEVEPYEQPLPAHLRAGDLFLYPSVTDTQGLVLCEALAAGLPCVAADAYGAKAVIRHGEEVTRANK